MRKTRNTLTTSQKVNRAVNGGPPSPGAALARRVKSKTRDASGDEMDEMDGNDSEHSPPPTKKRRVGANSQALQKKELHEKLFNQRGSAADKSTCSFPSRQHDTAYHRPLLLHPKTGRQAQDSLLEWFDSVSEARSMPWRKAWIKPQDVDDEAELRTLLSRRAYEVWISEIMLQQTRVAVVIDYWNRWMAKWPTIEDLAAADPEDVLAAWKGLGYYSRATRIHEAARLVVADENMHGLLPQNAKQLQDKVPGVGPYTAGAITAIVFGQPEAMVDGNVLRVLSRQLGLLANVKTDKATIDLLWAAADAIVKDVSRVEEQEGGLSDRPGRWGQGLMELGSTICTPKPNCSACPITASCRVYQEGTQLASQTKPSPPRAADITADIEDACQLCAPLEQAIDQDGEQKTNGQDSSDAKPAKNKPKVPKQATLAAFAFTRKSSDGQEVTKPAASDKSRQATSDVVAEHAKRFPLKVIKKPVREEETLVCALRDRNGRYLLHRRPEKGLLAGLWELPSCPIKDPEKTTAADRATMAQSHVAGLLDSNKGVKAKYNGDLGSVPWLFSHLKLTMHVYLFVVDGEDLDAKDGYPNSQSKWSGSVDAESMGTGMGKCWALVRDQEE